MAETPKKKLRQTPAPKTPIPQTPETLTTPRRSPRFLSSPLTTPRRTIISKTKTLKKKKKKPIEDAVSPISPDTTRKRRIEDDRYFVKPKRRVVSNDVGVGDDVHVNLREDDDDDPEIDQECRVCFKSGNLKCLKPTVPDGDWICGYCEAKQLGKNVKFPEPPRGNKRPRSAKENLLSNDLWAARDTKKRKRRVEPRVLRNGKLEGRKGYFVKPNKKVSYDGGEFAVGDDVYVKMREDASSDDDDPEIDQECRVCFKSGNLKCLKPTVPDRDWICGYCQAKQLGKKTELEKAKVQLSTLPSKSSFPCRNKEMDKINAFIKGAICHDQGGCLYIYGVSGIGKTMSVLAVMRTLRAEVDSGVTKPYSFVEINAQKLAAPHDIYRVIYQALTGHRVSWKKALNLLNDKFSNGSNDDDRPCILLIDELDLLVTRNQAVLYNIFNWPDKPNSKLIVIGIANTIDIPHKISRPMDLQKLPFAPYNHLELQQIIEFHLKGTDAFEKQAIAFASRKVAAVSGDARHALEICRRAAELADYRVKKSTLLPKTGKKLIGISEIEAASQEMFEVPYIQVTRTCSKLSKVFLAAMVHELHKTRMSETTFEKVALTASRMCVNNGILIPRWDTLLRICCKLGESRFILCEPGASHRLQKLQLKFSRSAVLGQFMPSVAKDCTQSEIAVSSLL